MGVELYELQALIDNSHGSGQTARMSRHGNYGLHAKFFVFDRKKLFIGTRKLIDSAEDFIKQGATRSSMSGRAYAMRCQDAMAVPAAQWLMEQLASYRLRQLRAPPHP